MKNLEMLRERLERQLKKVEFQLGNAKNEEFKNQLIGKQEALKMVLEEIKWEETKIYNNWD